MTRTRRTTANRGVSLTLEEHGGAGYGLVAHLAPVTARRLRAAIAAALREVGEDPGV